ncbi:hypothetical protein [Flavobacterium notoginsengisoli]|uniref:hypothetical protein n=1 Tax=Flavobacterium notoginsengisoli TaxID=1478199 RepID=UPI003635DDAD
MKIIQKYVWLLFLVLTIKTFGQNSVDPSFVKKVQKAAGAFKIKDPVASDPVAVDAKLVWNSKKTQAAVIVKAKLLEGWHIYAYVPSTQPYIQYKMVLELPESINPLGDWIKPNSYPYEDNIFVYKGEIFFIRYFSVENLKKDAVIKAGLFYQTCDIKQCLQPNTKSRDLKL